MLAAEEGLAAEEREGVMEGEAEGERLGEELLLRVARARALKLCDAVEVTLGVTEADKHGKGELLRLAAEEAVKEGEPEPDCEGVGSAEVLPPPLPLAVALAIADEARGLGVSEPAMLTLPVIEESKEAVVL